MELRRYGAVLARWWWLIALCTVLGAAAGYVVSRQLPPVYQARTTLFVNVSTTPGVPSYSDALLSQQLVKTYSQMAGQPVVLAAVAERLGLLGDTEELLRHVTITPVRDTQLLTIAAEGPDPALVQAIANMTAAVFIEQQNERLAQSQAANAISVVQPALLPSRPIAPRIGLNTAAAALAGLLIALVAVLVLEFLDDTVKSPEELERAASLPTLGAISRLPGAHQQEALASERTWRSPAFEGYRLIRTNLEFASVDQPLRSIAVTSSLPAEGKSTTVANLAVTLAHAGRRVIVVDADLRRPMLHRVFSVPNQQGLTRLLLAEGQPVGAFLQATSIAGLQVLPAGAPPPNPAEMLASPRMERVVADLVGQADIVLFDTPPVSAVADPLILAGRVDGTVLVVDAGKTRAEAVRRSCEALAKSGTRLVGGVLNKLSERSSYYRYYYTHGYASEPALGVGDALPGLSHLDEATPASPPAMRALDGHARAVERHTPPARQGSRPGRGRR